MAPQSGVALGPWDTMDACSRYGPPDDCSSEQRSAVPWSRQLSRPRAAGAADASDLYLVTLTGPGTAGNTGALTAAAFRDVELAAQDATLATVAAGVPIYRWTTALNGYAVALTPDQARTLAADPAVVSVEANSVRRLAGGAAGQGLETGAFAGRGGAGVVIGMIDSGLWADSPLFADVRGLGRAPQRYAATAPSGRAGAPRCATARSSAHSGSSTASAPIGCAAPPACRRWTTTATAR